MSSEAPSTITSGDSDTSIDLRTAFSHPAGLRVARYVVGSLLSAVESTLPPPSVDDSTLSIPVPTFDPSPEVASLLQSILALSDAEDRTPEQEDARPGAPIHYHYDNDNSISTYPSAMEFSQRDLDRSTCKQTQDFLSTNTSHQTNLSTFREPIRTSLTTTPRPGLALVEMNSHVGLPGSLTPGSDSPYRIESPSRTSANNTPQPPSLLSGEARMLVPDYSAGLGIDFFATRLPPMRKSVSSGAAQSSPFVSRDIGENSQTLYSGLGRGTSATTLQSSTSQSSNVTLTISATPTIKSFLPVNKTSNDNANSTVAKYLPGDSLLFADQSVSQQSQASNTGSTSSRPVSNQRAFGTTIHAFTMERTPSASAGQRHKGASDESSMKKQKTEKGFKRIVKLKEPKAELAAHKLGPDLWMRILEFTPPAFIRKARLLNKDFKTWIDEYSSIFVNQRIENYGADMPPASAIMVNPSFEDSDADQLASTTPGAEDAGGQEVAPVKETNIKKGYINERQYNDLLGGKGCLEPGCSDEKASRTHWSWAQRWCWACWKEKIEREDRILKLRQNAVGRQVLQDLLACIPNGMHDSFLKPHDYVTEEESRDRARGAPRLYRYYLKQEVDKIIAEYNKRTPKPYIDDPNLSPAANASAKAVHQIKETALIQKRQDWVDKMKARNAKWMETVKKIEAAIRKRREENGRPHEDYRNARKELFTRRAKEDLPQIPTEFVEQTKAYKAATRIFRDGGTERGWQTLKPKIEKEWQVEQKKRSSGNNNSGGVENEDSDIMDLDEALNESFEVESGNVRSMLANQQARFQQRQNMQHQHFLAQQRAVMQAHLHQPQPHRSFVNRYGANAQQPHSLSDLANAAGIANSLSYNSYGCMNSYQGQTSSSHNDLFGSMGFRSRNIGQPGYSQYAPPTNNGGMYQSSPSTQEPARTAITLADLLADPPSSGRKSSKSYPPH